MSTPFQVSQFKTLSISRLDVQACVAKFQKDPKRFINVGIFKNEDKTFQTVIKGKLTTDGVNEKKFEKGKKTYSIGIEFEDQSDIVGFVLLTEFVQQYLGNSFTVSSPVKDDDRYYVKVKEPKKISASRDQTAKITGELKVWINCDNKTAGISFDATNFEFED